MSATIAPAAPSVARAATAGEPPPAPRGVRRWRADPLALAFLLTLACLFYAPAVFGGKVLLPTDNLLLLSPWDAAAQPLEPGFVTPHNRLISDLILQNVGWKRYLADSLRHGQLPLWNPYLQAGTPFLASGQYQVLYPLGLLFVLLPVERAYGYFAALHLFIAGSGAYVFARALGYRRLPCLLAGVTFMLSERIVTSVVWPQMISAMAWLGWVLLWMELVLRAAARPEARWRRGVPLAIMGALTVAMQILSGHLEISFYVLFTALLYGALRIAADAVVPAAFEAGPRSAGARPPPSPVPTPSPPRDIDGGGRAPALRNGVALDASGTVSPAVAPSRPLARRAGVAFAQLCLLAAMGLGGLGLVAAQLVPFSEAIGQNFREGSVTFQEVSGWAMPARQFVAFVLPDVYGNPSQHDYVDVFTLRRRPIGPDAHGQPTDPPRTVSWGTKDYVEGASYVGILPLLLALVALVARWRTRPVALFAAIGLVSLLLATGSPLYKPLFLFVPGFSQIHSAFRWVYVYGFAVAVLAAAGLDALVSHAHRDSEAGTPSRPGRRETLPAWIVGWAAAIAGLLGLVAVAAGYVERNRLAARLQTSIDHNDILARSFTDGHELFSILYVQALRFAVLLALSGLIVWVGLHLSPGPSPGWGGGPSSPLPSPGWGGGPSSPLPTQGRGRGRGLLPLAAVALVAADLFSSGSSFASATPASLLRYTPPVVQRLLAAPGPFRIVSYKDDGLLNADTAMLWRLEDVRGYDTIVLRRYADFMGLIEPQTMLLPYSRVKGIDDPKALHNPLLNLLNVRYVLTKETISDPQYALWYQDPGGVRVYENTKALPRAFVVHQAQVVPSASAALGALGAPGFDPAKAVVLEGADAASVLPSTGAGTGVTDDVRITLSGPQRTEIAATLGAPGYLVLSDVNFPGWQATVDGRPAPVLQADEAFRAVRLEAGSHTVVFRYQPRSLRTGILVSLATLAALLLGLVAAGWGWLASRSLWQGSAGSAGSAASRRVAKNSLALMTASLCNKVLDFALIIWAATVIGAEGIGRYYFVVAVINFMSTVADFGLVTLFMRDVAQDRGRTSRYYGNVLALRWALAVILLLPTWVVAGPLRTPLQITPDTALALWILVAAFFPGALAATSSAVLKANEQMEYTAFADVAGNLLRIGLSILLLLGGWSVAGLAAAAFVVNVFNAAVYTGLVRKAVAWRSLRLDLGFCSRTLIEAAPLMVNQLLNVFFFRVDVLLLKPMTSDVAVGYYGIAYKFIDGLGFISAYLTQALFPQLSRSAKSDLARTRQATVLGLRVLLLLALPLAAGTVVLARPIVTLFYGAAMLPSVPALQILVLFLPFSFFNGLLQYVLIALGRQRQITVAYVVSGVFNVVANLVAIHFFGFLGAAAVTVASELVLLAPFYALLRRDLGPLPWGTILLRPAIAAAAMAAAVALCRGVLIAAIPVGAASYALALALTGSVTREDLALLRRFLGRGEERGVVVGTASGVPPAESRA